MSTATEKERQQRQDLAEANRFGEGFGFGEVKTATRVIVRQGKGQMLAGGMLVITAICVGLDLGLAGVPATPKLIAVAGAACAAVIGWQLVRFGLRPRAENRLFLYSAGLIQLVHDEPEPRVLRWEDLDSAEISFDSFGDDSSTGLDICTLRGRTGTEITVRATSGRVRWIPRQLAAEADRVLSPQLIPPLIRAYESGEPVIVGPVRIDRDGVEVDHSRKPALQAAWTEVSAIVINYDSRSGFGVPARSIRIDRANRRSSLGLQVSGVPNAILLPHLIEHVAEQHGLTLRRSGP